MEKDFYKKGLAEMFDIEVIIHDEKEREIIHRIIYDELVHGKIKDVSSRKDRSGMMGNEIGAIFVRPEKQGKGIGKALINVVSQYHEVLEVEVFKDNMIGRAFYDKYGFKVIKEYIHEETGRAVLRMQC